MSDPQRVTFRVWAIGTTDAAEQAAIEAHKAGYRIKARPCSLRQITPHVRDNRRERLEWDVTLERRAR